MRQLVLFFAGLSASALAADTAAQMESLTNAKLIGPQPATEAPSSVSGENTPASAQAATPAAAPVRRAAPRPSPKVVVSRPRIDVKRMGDWRGIYEEAKALLVPDQNYVLQFEEEESFGRMSATGTVKETLDFSKSDVEKFRKAVQTLADYRAAMGRSCLSSSSKAFMEALDKYVASLCSFHRRALNIVGDISENNDALVLLVNRTTLKDAAVLSSRYLQFKKQRFKESMDRFRAGDTALVESLSTIAKILRTEVTDEDLKKPYGLRDHALELASLWPRETIFDATQKLNEMKEAACVVQLTGESGQKTAR